MRNPLLGHPVLEGVDLLFLSGTIKVTGVRLPATSVEVSSGFRVGGAATFYALTLLPLTIWAASSRLFAVACGVGQEAGMVSAASV